MVSQTSIGSVPKPGEFIKKFFSNANSGANTGKGQSSPPPHAPNGRD